MKKNVKIGLAVGAAVIVLACVLLIPFKTINVDIVKTFGGDTATPSGTKLLTYSAQCAGDTSKCPFPESTTDTFDLVSDSGVKLSNVKLNVTRLLTEMINIVNAGNTATTFPVKTNLLHTMYIV